MSFSSRSDVADKIKRAVQTVLRQHHLEHSCFLMTRAAVNDDVSYWEVVAMTSRGKIAFGIETTAADSEDDLSLSASSAIARALSLLACPTCKGAGYIGIH